MPICSSLNLVIDSNIWIYLYYCGLVNAAFQLGSLHAPDVMRTEEPITETTWDDLEDQGLVLDELTSDDVRVAVVILDNNRRLSFCDAACLVLAEKNGISLVTHDKKLLGVARKGNVPAHNFDALLELMVTAGTISSAVRTVAIQTLVERGMRPR